MLSAQKASKELAEEMAQEMRDVLYHQRFKMAPLSPDYFDFKSKQGLDTRTLIATKKYVQNIGVIKTHAGYTIGMVHKTRNDGGRNLSYAVLQRWLEYGTRRRLPGGGKGKIGSQMPARPHWRPFMRYWKANRAQHALKIKKAIGVDLQKLLNRGRV